jgi:hypothetical protein
MEQKMCKIVQGNEQLQLSKPIVTVFATVSRNSIEINR